MGESRGADQRAHRRSGKKERNMQFTSPFAEANFVFTVDVVGDTEDITRVKGYVRDLFRFSSLYAHRNEQEIRFTAIFSSRLRRFFPPPLKMKREEKNLPNFVSVISCGTVSRNSLANNLRTLMPCANWLLPTIV